MPLLWCLNLNSWWNASLKPCVWSVLIAYEISKWLRGKFSLKHLINILYRSWFFRSTFFSTFCTLHNVHPLLLYSTWFASWMTLIIFNRSDKLFFLAFSSWVGCQYCLLRQKFAGKRLKCCFLWLPQFQMSQTGLLRE